MHNIKPNQCYKIVMVQIAFPDDVENDSISGEISALLSEHESLNIADWKYLPGNAPEECRTFYSSSDPAEGEIFNGIQNPRLERQGSEAERLGQMLEELRQMRDKQDLDFQTRSYYYNTACDRLDVLLSKLIHA